MTSMRRLLVFREDALVVPETPGLPDPVVALDPETFEAELLLDRAVQSIEPEGPLDITLPLDPPRPPPPGTGPFRAVVVPQRLHGLEVRPPLNPGARPAGVEGVVPRDDRPELLLTVFPTKVTASGAQALELAQDVLDIDELVLTLRVLSLSGSAVITVALETGMQIESTKGWVSAGAFSAVSSAPTALVRPFRNLLRYVRWSATLSGASPAATFFLSGVGRTWSTEFAPVEMRLT
jgi:hypothetical protein